MDVVICAPRTQLLAEPVQTLADALDREGCHIRSVRAPDAIPSGGADIVILTSETDWKIARKQCRTARIVEISIDGSSNIGQLLRRAAGAGPDMSLGLFPRKLRGKARQGGFVGHVALSREMPCATDTPVWLHAMPKDIPTVLLCPQTCDEIYEPIWERAGGDDPFNLICFSKTDPDRLASNIYFKPDSQIVNALDFAQFAVIEENENLVWQCLRKGIPVVHVTEFLNTELACALNRLRLGVATRPQDLDAAMVRVLRNPAYQQATKAFAARHHTAPAPDILARRLMARAGTSRPTRRFGRFTPAEAS